MRQLLAGFAFAASSLVLAPTVVEAATPTSGTVSPAMATTDFSAGPFLTSTGFFCTLNESCEIYGLTAQLPANYDVTNPGAVIRIGLAWQGRADLFTFTLTDLDTGAEVAGLTSSTDLGFQTFYFPAGNGTRRLQLEITPLANNNSTVLGAVSLQAGDNVGLQPNPVGPGVPRYQQYVPPEALNGDTGEPSVGYNPNSKQAWLLSGLRTLFLKFPQDQTPALPQACDGTWADRSAPVTNATTLDPIGVADSLVKGRQTSRLWIGQLVGVNSAMSFSDDDGLTWTPNQGGPPLAATDHQTIAAGPYPASLAPVFPTPIYPNAFYYCGQDIGFASCARSDNGGLTFNQPVPIYSIADCAGIHGHVRVAPDGTVAVPEKACGTNVAITVSEDAGTTWAIRKVPGSVPSIRDPSIGWASDSTGYFCYSNGPGRATVSVTKDKGRSFAPAVDLGANMGIKHVMFTHAIAGDPDRATCAYLGTTTEGNPTAADFPGVWHLYFSTTYDGGKTWTTVNGTPNDPVQGVGGIWNSGGSATNRNLLDFNEITIDENGYPMYGYADGCMGGCDLDPKANTYAAFPKLVRQIAGKSLYAAKDVAEPRAPANACLAGVRTVEKTQLTWKAPENGGAAIASYKVYRSLSPDVATTAANQVGTTNGTPAFVDPTASPSIEKYYYRVTALNAQGEGIGSNEVELPIVVPEVVNPCEVPGVRIVTDALGDATGGMAANDVQSLHIAEPQAVDGNLLVTLKIANLAMVPPGTMYTVRFHTPAQPLTSTADSFVGMVSEAGTIRYVYGTRTDEVAVAAGYQIYSVVDDLPTGSTMNADGTIVFQVPRALFGLDAGESLTAISANTHTGATGSGDHIARSTNTLDTADNGGSYAVRSAALCLPNTVPVARLLADKVRGETPLVVSFDGASSSDAEDAIAEYTLDYGDGSAPVTQVSPSFTHTYMAKGFYNATLKVTDARGLVSSTDRLVIEVIEAVQQAVAPFNFIERTNVRLNTFVTSELIAVQGFTGSLPVTVSEGLQYSIDGGPFTNAPGSIVAGQKIAVRHISANAENTARESMLTVGGGDTAYSTVFRTVTTTLDRVPDAFDFGTVQNQAPGTLVESEVRTLKGYDTASIVAGPGLSYSLNGAPFTSNRGTLDCGNANKTKCIATLKVRHTTNTASLGYTKSTLTVGGIKGTFITRTRK